MPRTPSSQNPLAFKSLKAKLEAKKFIHSTETKFKDTEREIYTHATRILGSAFVQNLYNDIPLREWTQKKEEKPNDAHKAKLQVLDHFGQVNACLISKITAREPGVDATFHLKATSYDLH